MNLQLLFNFQISSWSAIILNDRQTNEILPKSYTVKNLNMCNITSVGNVRKRDCVNASFTSSDGHKCFQVIFGGSRRGLSAIVKFSFDVLKRPDNRLLIILSRKNTLKLSKNGYCVWQKKTNGEYEHYESKLKNMYQSRSNFTLTYKFCDNMQYFYHFF